MTLDAFPEPGVPFKQWKPADGSNYLVYDTHRKAPTGFAVRVSKKASVYLVEKQVAGKNPKIHAGLARGRKGDEQVIDLDTARERAHDLGAWAAEGHDVGLNSGWQAIDRLFRRDVRCRRPEGCQRSPANASAGAVCPVLPAQAGIKVAIRRRFSAAHTSFHSARTRSIPRRLNWRNPSTLLIQPLGGSAIHLRFR